MSGGAAQAAGPEVHRIWGPLVPEDGVFVAVAARADGSALAITGDGAWSIDPQGTLSSLGRGELAVLNPGGETFALLDQGTLELFDRAGDEPSAFPVVTPFDRFQLIPGTKLLYAPKMRLSEEVGWVESVQILDSTLAPIGSFAAPGLEISRFAADRIVYSQGDRLIARRLDGTALWQSEIAVHKLETASDRSIVVPRFTRGEVVHLLQGKRIAVQTVDGVVWNLAISPSGRTSAATTRNALAIFRDGLPVARVPLRVAYANSLAASDRGEVLVGGQSDRGAALLFLFDSGGKLLWSETGGREHNGYRPAVAFVAGGEGFTVIEKRGLSFYRIDRGQP